MKYMHRNVVVMLTIFLFMTTCSKGERIKEISDVETTSFFKVIIFKRMITFFCIRNLWKTKVLCDMVNYISNEPMNLRW
ncbi:hypothetical protein BALU111458_10060 [Bacillus luti]